MFLPEAEQAEFQAACATLVGWLDRLSNEAHRSIMSGHRSAASYGRDATRLSQQITDFYATTFREFDADDDELSEDLTEVRAEDFDHFPPTKKSQA